MALFKNCKCYYFFIVFFIVDVIVKFDVIVREQKVSSCNAFLHVKYFTPGK